jgi:hypothetical protein
MKKKGTFMNRNFIQSRLKIDFKREDTATNTFLIKEEMVRHIRTCVVLFVIFCFGFMPNLEAQTTNDHKRNSKEPNFPNAIFLSREDINGILVGLVGDNPNGIASLLALKAGLTFRNTGDPGAETWFITRNFGRDNSRLTLVLLDGRPINLSNNHTVEFDVIPINIIESITIYPGPVPTRFGGYHFVVEIVTQRNEDIAFASVNIGSNDNYRITSTFGKSGNFHYLFNFDADLAAGQTGRSLNGILSDFTYGNREVRTILPTLKVGYEFNDNIDLTFQSNLVDFKKMFDTGLHHGKEASRVRRSGGYSLLLSPGRKGTLDYSVMAYHNRERETLNPVFPEDISYNVKWGKQRRSMSGFRGHYKHKLSEVIHISAGGEFHYSKGKLTEEDDNVLYFKYVDEQIFYGSFANAEFFLPTNTYISLGGRFDAQNKINDMYFSPVFAVNQKLMDGKLQLYGIYGMSSRWIPLNEVNTFVRPERILGPPFLQGQVDMPSRNLSMERMQAIDLGIKVKLFDEKLAIRTNYYNLRNKGQFGTPFFEIRPLVEGAQVPPGFNAAIVTADRNFPGYDYSEGIELELELKPWKVLSFFANMSYTIRAETLKDDDIVLYEGPLGGPAAQAFINQSVGQFVLPYHNAPIIPGAYDMLANCGVIYRPNEKSIINTIFRYRGNTEKPLMKFGKDPEVDRIPSSLVVDLAAGYDLYKKDTYSFRGIASVNNLMNLNYETFVHYPMQGRFISLGLQVSFK